MHSWPWGRKCHKSQMRSTTHIVTTLIGYFVSVFCSDQFGISSSVFPMAAIIVETMDEWLAVL